MNRAYMKTNSRVGISKTLAESAECCTVMDMATPHKATPGSAGSTRSITGRAAIAQVRMFQPTASADIISLSRNQNSEKVLHFILTYAMIKHMIEKYSFVRHPTYSRPNVLLPHKLYGVVLRLRHIFTPRLIFRFKQTIRVKIAPFRISVHEKHSFVVRASKHQEGTP